MEVVVLDRVFGLRSGCSKILRLTDWVSLIAVDTTVWDLNLGVNFVEVPRQKERVRAYPPEIFLRRGTSFFNYG